MMRRLLVCAGLLGIVVAAGCRSSTEPTPPSVLHVLQLTQIEVPDRAAATDTIRISFSYAPGFCDTAVVVTSRPAPDGMSFMATSYATSGVCPAIAIRPRAVACMVLPLHAAPFRVTFTEPASADSVRVVAP